MHTNHQLSLGQLSDETLIARVARSDRNALQTLYDRYAPIVLGISLKITSDRVAAEEVLEETFWQVWQGAASYQVQGGTFTSWLFRIARKLATDTYHWKLNNK